MSCSTLARFLEGAVLEFRMQDRNIGFVAGHIARECIPLRQDVLKYLFWPNHKVCSLGPRCLGRLILHAAHAVPNLHLAKCTTASESLALGIRKQQGGVETNSNYYTTSGNKSSIRLETPSMSIHPQENMHTSAYTQMHAHICTHTRKHKHAHIHTYTHTQTRTHARKHKHAHKHTHTHAHTHACIITLSQDKKVVAAHPVPCLLCCAHPHSYRVAPTQVWAWVWVWVHVCFYLCAHAYLV